MAWVGDCWVAVDKVKAVVPHGQYGDYATIWLGYQQTLTVPRSPQEVIALLFPEPKAGPLHPKPEPLRMTHDNVPCAEDVDPDPTLPVEPEEPWSRAGL